MSMEKCPVCGNLVFMNDSHAKSDAKYLGLTANKLAKIAYDLETENAKLRELVEDAVEAASLDDVRDWSIGHRLRLIRQARELGIETDDV